MTQQQANQLPESATYKIIQDEGTHIIYEPEQFPGAIIRFILPEKSKATILLFASGKLVCVGLKTRKDVDDAIHYVSRMIS